MELKNLIMPDIPDWLKSILATENTSLPLLSYKQGQLTFAVALIDANGDTADLYFFNGKNFLIDEKKIGLKNEIDINSDFSGQKISQKIKAKLAQNLILAYNLMTSGESKDECKKVYCDYCNEIQKIMPRNASEIYTALDSVYNIKFYNLQDYKDAEITASENLSEVTASEFTALEALSNYITLLPVAENARKGMLKFSAPEICTESDFDGDEPKLLQILKMLKNEEKPKERKIGTIIGKTINRKCGACDDCAFDFCPYIKSAYLKYLREYNQERLTAERSDYAKNKKAVERSDEVKVKLAPPQEKVNRKSITNAVKDLESLNISIVLAEDKLAVTTLDYIKPADGTKLISNRGLVQALSQDSPLSFTTSKVDLAELAKEGIWKGEIHNDNGEKLDRRVAYAIIAWTTIKQVGSVDDLLNFEPNPQKEEKQEKQEPPTEKTKKEEVTAEVQSGITEVKKSAKNAKKPTTEPKTEQKRIVAVTATILITPQKAVDVEEYLGGESKAYKYLTSSLDCFYGVLVVGDCKENEAGLLEGLKIELKKKNLDLEVTSASDLNKDFMFEPKKAKILVGTQKEIKDYLEVHEASKGLTTKLCIWTDFQAKDLMYNDSTLDFVTERFEDYPCEQKHIKDWVIYNITEI